MRLPSLRTPFGWLALPALTLSVAASAYADGAAHDGHATSGATPAAEHGMSADEHAAMTADEHADMTAGAESAGAAVHGGHADSAAEAAGGDAGAAAGERGERHGEPAAAEERPVGLVLTGFGLVNGAVIVAATVLRGRPAARKRLKTLARVRSAAGKPTVSPKPAAREARS